MKDKIRLFSLEAVTDLPLGTHFCQFYQTKEELLEITGPYFKAGLENSELCIWALPQLLNLKEAKQALSKVIPEFESYLKEGQIEILSDIAWQEEKEKEGTKERRESTDSQKNLDFLTEKLSQALEKGYKGLRIAEDSSRAKKENWNNFLTYQEKLDSFIYKKPLIVLFTSSLKDFDTFELLESASRAQFALVKKAGKWERVQSNNHNGNRKKNSEDKSQYHEIFNSIIQGIQLCELVFNEKGQPVDNIILDANPAYEKHSGLKREQVVGKRIKEVLPGVEQAWLDRYAEVVLKRKNLHFEEYNASLDMWFEVFASPLEGNKFITVFNDITQRKRMEENQERFKALMDHNPSLVFMKDEKGRYIYLNNTYEKQFVHSKDWHGKTDFDFWPKESAELFRANDAYVLESGQPQKNLEDSTDLNGIRYCWLNYKFPFTDSKNERYVGGIGIDVTDRVRTEEALSRERSLLESVMQATDFMLAFLDSQFNFMWVNPAYAETCQMKPEDMVGKNYFVLYPHEENEAIFRKVRATGEGVFYKDKPFAFLDQPEQGVTYWDWSLAPVKNSEGNVTGLVFSSRETTKYKQAEEALHQSEQHYRLLFETMLQGVVYQDADGKIISMNPAAEKILGKTPAEFLGSSSVSEERNTIRGDGSSFSGLEHPAMLSLQTGKEVQDVVMGVYNPQENKYRWISVNAVPIIRPGEEKPFQVYTIFNDITERKRVEDALRESEERYRTLFNTMDEGFCIIEMLFDENEKPIDYVFTETNPAFERQTGFKDAVGKRIRELAPKNEEYWYEIYGKVALTGESVRFENRVEELHRWYEVYAYRIGEEESRKVAILFNDITERKQVEEDLKKALETLRYSEDQFRTLVQNVKSGIALIDEIGSFTVVNPTFMQMFGLDDELDILNVNSQDWSQWEVYGEDLKLLHVDDHPVRKVMMTGKPVKSQLVAVKNPGANKLTWMLINAEPIQKEKGQIYRVICTYQDITERRRVEEALKKAHDTLEETVKERTKQLAQAYKSLKESERGLAEAQKMAHIGNWDWNLRTGEIYWSDEEYRIFGLSPQETEITYELFLNYVHSEDKEYIDNLNKRASKGEPYNTEFRIIAADGTERIVHEQRETVFDEKKVPVRIRGTTQDITERKKTEKALVELETARLKEIHHRIKNNLQVISSLLDLQAENLNSKPGLTHSEILEAFRESQDRVASIALIHEELYAGKGTDSLNFSLYLQKLVKSLFQTYRIGNSNISLKLDLPENIFFDMDNAIPLGIIVNELVSNSLKHAFPGRDAGELRIKIIKEEQPQPEDIFEGNEGKGGDTQENKVKVKTKVKAKIRSGKGTSINYTLSVSDNGVGIPESIDLENSETLGLQLVTILTDQLDGTLDLKRSPGTEFIIKFTLADLGNLVEKQ